MVRITQAQWSMFIFIVWVAYIIYSVIMFIHKYIIIRQINKIKKKQDEKNY